jgi:hypothetical protein
MDPDKIVVIEWMPAHLIESHRAAGGFGEYPHNGSQRSLMRQYDAMDAVVADENEYARIVGDAPCDHSADDVVDFLP